MQNWNKVLNYQTKETYKYETCNIEIKDIWTENCEESAPAWAIAGETQSEASTLQGTCKHLHDQDYKEPNCIWISDGVPLSIED